MAGPTILLVDDEPLVRQFVGLLLKNAGYHVLEAGGPAEALMAFNACDADLLLTDVIMPGMSGTELAAQLKRDRPDLPVLFISGYCQDFAGDMQGHLCIQKPFHPQTLLAQVRAALVPPRLETRP